MSKPENEKVDRPDHVVRALVAAQRWRAVHTGDLDLYRKTLAIEAEIAALDALADRDAE